MTGQGQDPLETATDQDVMALLREQGITNLDELVSKSLEWARENVPLDESAAYYITRQYVKTPPVVGGPDA